MSSTAFVQANSRVPVPGLIHSRTSIDPNDIELDQTARSDQVDVELEGQIATETKKEMCARGLPSPDGAGCCR